MAPVCVFLSATLPCQSFVGWDTDGVFRVCAFFLFSVVPTLIVSGLPLLFSYPLTHHQYDSLDPLGLGNGDAIAQRRTMGEWDSVCDVRGYGGFRSFKIRPKKLSRHGRQYVRWDNSEEPLFNMSNVSRLKSQSIRHSTAACREDSRDPVWTITSDMMERTQVVLNEKEEQVAFVQKSLKTLILNAQFGKGSEVVIDIAPGVDQTGTCARVGAPPWVAVRAVFFVRASPCSVSSVPSSAVPVVRPLWRSWEAATHRCCPMGVCTGTSCQQCARVLSFLSLLAACSVLWLAPIFVL